MEDITKLLEKEMDAEVLEKISCTIATKIKRLHRKTKPKEIFLYGANPNYLVKVMISLYDKLKREKVKVFIRDSAKGYSVDVGLLLKREDIREFLEQEAAAIYNSSGGFSRLEKWAESYKGKHKYYLPKIIKYIQKRNSRGDSRILSLDSQEIESILEATIPQ